MIERLLEIRNKISFNIWFITELPKKTVELILDVALLAIIAVVVLTVVAVCRLMKYRREKVELKCQMDEADEDDEDGQMVEITTKGRDGTKTVKVPAMHISFKQKYYENESKEEMDGTTKADKNSTIH